MEYYVANYSLRLASVRDENSAARSKKNRNKRKAHLQKLAKAKIS